MNYHDLSKEQRMEFMRLQNDNSWSFPDEVACPYCNHTQNFEYEDMLYDDDKSWTHTCNDCEKEFEITTHVTTDWSTSIPDDEVMEMVLADEERD